MDLSILSEGRIRSTIAQWARDLEMMVGPWRGRTPAPFRARTPRGGAPFTPAAAVPSATASAPAIGLGARELVVRERIVETDEAITLVLADPGGGSLAFVPGSFFTVIVTIDGVEHRRAYSGSGSGSGSGLGSTGPLAVDRLALTIKRVAGGLVSGHLHDRVAVGDTLRILGPSGAFTLEPAALGRRRVMIAGGSGITPIMAMIRAALAGPGDGEIALIYGNRRRASIIFAAALAELAAAHPQRLRIRHVLEDMTDETGDPEGDRAQPGRLDPAGLGAALAALEWAPTSVDGFHVCGPEPMLAAARAVLDGLGVDAGRRHEERFTGPERRSGPRTAASAAVTVTIRRGGGERALVVPAGRTLLEAAQAAGEALPFSCAMGGCGACKVRVIAGEVVMDEPNCLSASERAAGHALTCVGAPAGPCVLEVVEVVEVVAGAEASA